jgi:hypothetical protein
MKKLLLAGALLVLPNVASAQVVIITGGNGWGGGWNGPGWGGPGPGWGGPVFRPPHPIVHAGWGGCGWGACGGGWNGGWNNGGSVVIVVPGGGAVPYGSGYYGGYHSSVSYYGGDYGGW